MVNVFNIIVTGAMLVLGNDVNNPIPYCTVQLQQPTIEGLAREYSAKAALRQHYEKQAKRLGMTLRGYCFRFNVRGIV